MEIADIFAGIYSDEVLHYRGRSALLYALWAPLKIPSQFQNQNLKSLFLK